jgi:hypothetical protein
MFAQRSAIHHQQTKPAEPKRFASERCGGSDEPGRRAGGKRMDAGFCPQSLLFRLLREVVDDYRVRLDRRRNEELKKRLDTAVDRYGKRERACRPHERNVEREVGVTERGIRHEGKTHVDEGIDALRDERE